MKVEVVGEGSEPQLPQNQVKAENTWRCCAGNKAILCLLQHRILEHWARKFRSYVVEFLLSILDLDS